MKVLILAGGFGYRMSEDTVKLPKPMVKIGNLPILEHIINFYISYGFEDFIVSGGYKYTVIKKYFQKHKNLRDKVKVINTGLKTQTGGRIKRAQHLLNKNEDFMVTYGDGLSNVNLDKLLKFHLKQDKIGTVTSVRPVARFGEIEIKNKHVVSFKEKPQVSYGWINGGFFIFKYSFLKYINGAESILEKQPLEALCKKKQLSAFQHSGFWQCMDTRREKEFLDKLAKKRLLWKKK